MIARMANVCAMKPFFEPIIRRWESVPRFAAEVGCDERIVRQWLIIDSIPAAWFSAVHRAAHKRGLRDITADSLASLAERRRLAKEAVAKDEAA